MKVRWAVLCDYANNTQEGKLNLMGVFNRIGAARYPAVHSSMALVIKFAVDPAEFGRKQSIIVQLADADGKRLFEAETEIVIERQSGGPQEFDNILTLNNVVFPHAGAYAFDVLVNNSAQYSVPLTMVEGPALPGRQGK